MKAKNSIFKINKIQHDKTIKNTRLMIEYNAFWQTINIIEKKKIKIKINKYIQKIRELNPS